MVRRSPTPRHFTLRCSVRLPMYALLRLVQVLPIAYVVRQLLSDSVAYNRAHLA